MKTLKILTLSLVLLFAGTILGYSNEENSVKKVAIEQLNKDIKKLFKGIPFNEVMCGKKECKISVFFKVNDKGIVEIYHITGKNSILVEYSKKVFANNVIKADNQIFSDEVYWINVVIQYKDF